MKVYAFSPWPSSSPFIYDRVGWPMLGFAMLVSLRLLLVFLLRDRVEGCVANAGVFEDCLSLPTPSGALI